MRAHGQIGRDHHRRNIVEPTITPAAARPQQVGSGEAWSRVETVLLGNVELDARRLRQRIKAQITGACGDLERGAHICEQDTDGLVTDYSIVRDDVVIARCSGNSDSWRYQTYVVTRHHAAVRAVVVVHEIVVNLVTTADQYHVTRLDEHQNSGCVVEALIMIDFNVERILDLEPGYVVVRDILVHVHIMRLSDVNPRVVRARGHIAVDQAVAGKNGKDSVYPVVDCAIR